MLTNFGRMRLLSPFCDILLILEVSSAVIKGYRPLKWWLGDILHGCVIVMQSEYLHAYIYIHVLGRLYLDHGFASLDVYLYMRAILLSR